MPINVVCPECKKALRIAEENAGKKVRCPQCQKVFATPLPDVEEVEAVEAVEPEDKITSAPGRAGAEKPARRRREEPEDEDSDEPPRKRRPIEDDEDAPPRKRRRGGDDDEDEDDDRPRKRRRRQRQGEFADCPQCGSPGEADRVSFTWWGGLIGPRLMCHVRCRRCGTCYNGRTGNYNTTGIVIYTVVGLVLALVFVAFAILANAH